MVEAPRPEGTGLVSALRTDDAATTGGSSVVVGADGHAALGTAPDSPSTTVADEHGEEDEGLEAMDDEGEAVKSTGDSYVPGYAEVRHFEKASQPDMKFGGNARTAEVLPKGIIGPPFSILPGVSERETLGIR